MSDPAPPSGTAPVPAPHEGSPDAGAPGTGLGRQHGDPHGVVRGARRRAAARAGARQAVAEALRVLRERAGLTQERLGARAGLHRTYVGGYERAERRLTVEAVEQVLAALGVSWAAFGAELDARLRRRAPRA